MQKKEQTTFPFITEQFLMNTIRTLLKLKSVAFADSVKKLLSLIDKEFYSSHPTIYALLITINVISDFIAQNVTKTSIMMTQIEIMIPDNYVEIKESIIMPLLTDDISISDADIQVLKNAISKATTIALIHTSHKEILRKMAEIEKANILSINEDIDAYVNTIIKLATELETYGNSVEDFMMITHNAFHSDKFLKPAYDFVKNDIYRNITGIQELNSMIDPTDGIGFQPRLYTFIGKSGSYKSLLLMYCLKWICKYNLEINKKYIEEGIKPTVLYLTLENMRQEEIDRMFTIFDDGTQLRQFTSFEAASVKWSEIISNSPISISMIFGEDLEQQFTPNKIYALIKNYQMKNNVKVVAVVIDYLKMLNSDTLSNEEFRIKLGSIAEGLKRINKAFQIPVITSHHLNREGDRLLDELASQGKTNICRHLYEGYIGETKLVEDKSDMIIFIHREQSQWDGQWYLSFKRSKSRSGQGGTEYFAYPLKHGYLLLDDLHGPKKSVPEISAFNPYIDNKQEMKSRGMVSEVNTISKNDTQKTSSTDKIIDNIIYISNFNTWYKNLSKLNQDFVDYATNMSNLFTPFHNPDYEKIPLLDLSKSMYIYIKNNEKRIRYIKDEL